MSMPKVGGKIVLEGEKEYREALSNINAGLRVNYSQMQLVAAQYDNASSSQEALRAKSLALNDAISAQDAKYHAILDREQRLNEYKEKLSAAIENQRKKTASLTEAYEASVSATGKDSDASKKLEEQLGSAKTALEKLNDQQEKNNVAILQNKANYTDAQTQLEKMKSQLKSYDAAMESSRDKTVSVSDVVHNLTSALGINLPPAADKAIDALGQMSASSALLVGGTVALVAALVKLESKMLDVTKAAAENAASIGTEAKQYSLTAEQVQELHQAEQAIEVDQGTITSSMTKLTAKIKDNSDAFATLGVSTKDSNGQYRDSLDIYYDTIDALGQVTNQTEADTLAQELFGKSYADVKPLVEAGSAAIKQYGQDSEEAGYIMSNDTVAALDAVYQKNLDVEDGWKSISNTLASVFAPAMSDTDDELTNGIQPILRDLGKSTVPLLAEALQLVMELVKGAEPELNIIAFGIEGIALVIEIVIAEINSLYQAVKMLRGEQSSFDWSYWDYAAGTYSAMQSTGSRVASSLSGNAAGTNYWTGGRTLVGENGPEIVDLPRGSRIYPSGQTPAAGNTVTNYYQITIPANSVKEFNDIVSIAQNEATSIRQGVTT